MMMHIDATVTMHIYDVARVHCTLCAGRAMMMMRMMMGMMMVMMHIDAAVTMHIFDVTRVHCAVQGGLKENFNRDFL